MNMLKATFSFLLGTSFITYSQAECPNACSMQGTCGPRDQCTCYKHYQGNDCSERICPFGNAHVDVPKGDLNMDGEHKFDDDMKYHQVYPNEVSELWNSGGEGSKGHAGEAHYYMECSARGLCDRSSGTCTCFDGYEGVSCQRLSCPNSCSGHGTCESVKELSSKATGTDLTFKPLVSAKSSYDLWDARYYYGCKCDPSYFGHDCSQRRCPVGVDPMYENDASARFETIRILVDRGTGAVLTTTESTFRIRFFDYWGASYVTDKIFFSGTNEAGTASNIERALKALPNAVIENISCAHVSSATGYKYVTGHSANKDNYYCTLTHNPGKLRLAEIVAGSVVLKAHATDRKDNTGSALTLSSTVGVFLLPTVVSGEDRDFAATLTTDKKITSTSSGQVAITFQANPFTTYPALFKVNDMYLVAVSATALAFGYPHATNIAAATTTHLSSITVTASLAGLTAATLGSKSLTFATGHGLSVGDQFFAYNILYTVTESSTTTVKVDKPFGGDHTGASVSGVDVQVYKITNLNNGSFEYVNECSNRGLCNRDYGLCECFTGYKAHNCDTQTIISG